MEKLELKHITLMDEVETKEAAKIFKEHQRKYSAFFIVPLVVSIVFFVLVFMSSTQSNQLPISMSVMLKVAVGAALVAILGFAIYTSMMRPYWKLLRIAKLNDRIRHEERIREKERKRLADPANKDKKYTVDDIDNTLPDENAN